MKIDIVLAVDQLQHTIIMLCHNNCPAKTTRSLRKVLWWNENLSGLIAKTRTLFNVPESTDQ
jgi:hypothetical protein